MRVGVTGAGGFLGAALVAAFEGRGDHVVRFVRAPTTGAPGSLVRWDPAADLLDVAELRAIGPLDALVHLAGAGIADRRWSPERKDEILSSRVRSTRLLVDAAREAFDVVPFLASASAVGYYGSRADEVLDEGASPGSDFLARLCVQWEDEAGALRPSGSGVATLRMGIVSGASGGALRRQLGLFRWGLGGRLGPGTQWLSPISLEDAVRAVLFVVDRRLDGPINVVAPCALTNRDFTSALARALHRPAVLPVPSFALRLALGRELADGVVLASQRVVPRALVNAGFAFHHADVDSLLRSAISTPH